MTEMVEVSNGLAGQLRQIGQMVAIFFRFSLDRHIYFWLKTSFTDIVEFDCGSGSASVLQNGCSARG